MALRLIVLLLLPAAFAGCRDILSSTKEEFADHETRAAPDTLELDTAWLFDAVRGHLEGSGLADSLQDWIRTVDSADWEGDSRSDSAETGLD